MQRVFDATRAYKQAWRRKAEDHSHSLIFFSQLYRLMSVLNGVRASWSEDAQQMKAVLLIESARKWQHGIFAGHGYTSIASSEMRRKSGKSSCPLENSLSSVLTAR